MGIDEYERTPPDDGLDDSSNTPGSRRYIGVLFECCGVYQRIYRRPEQAEYAGRCPRCLRSVCVRVGPDGTSARIFRAR